VRLLAGGMAAVLGAAVDEIDFTLPAGRAETYAFGSGDLVVLGVPVYAGRVPNKLLPFLRTGLQGGGALAVPVVTFGNRSFDDALSELRSELIQDGFQPFAAAALACGHAFSDRVAPGRPDETDLAAWERFAADAGARAAALTGPPAPVAVPGRNPVGPYYTPLGTDGAPAVFLKAKPETDREKCTRCGLCARLCPMGSISPEDPAQVPGVCIKCQACVRCCPAGAKYFSDPAFLSHVAMLERSFSRRAEPSFFL